MSSQDRAVRARRDEVVIEPGVGRGSETVPNGLVHHWIGAIFIPGANIESTWAVFHDYDNYSQIWAICNGAVAGVSNNTGSGRYSGEVGLVVPLSGATHLSQGSYTVHRFHNDDLLLGDPLIAWGTGSTEEAKINGQLWDCLVACNDMSADTVIPINGHNVWNLTASNVGGGSDARGSLLMAVS